MARTAADLREAEGLLRRAQRAPEAERLWLLTVTWQLLHEIASDLGAQQTAQPPTSATARTSSSSDNHYSGYRTNGVVAGETAYHKVVSTRKA
jgi:hypothetical protein